MSNNALMTDSQEREAGLPAKRSALTRCVLALVVGLTFSAAAGDQSQENLASKVIQSDFHAGYNPTNNSEQELTSAAIVNSELRLQHLILHEASDELRICFALRILKEQIVTARHAISLAGTNSGPAQAHLATLLASQGQLALELRAIQTNQTKASKAASLALPNNLHDYKREEKP